MGQTWHSKRGKPTPPCGHPSTGGDLRHTDTKHLRLRPFSFWERLEERAKPGCRTDVNEPFCHLSIERCPLPTMPPIAEKIIRGIMKKIAVKRGALPCPYPLMLPRPQPESRALGAVCQLWHGAQCLSQLPE